MRKLQDVPNIGGISTAYPDGVIVDQVSGITGTALTELLYGDLIQAVHKLKRLAGLTENSLPDNEANGFQMLTALLAQGFPTWQPPSSNVDLSKNKFVVYNNGIYYHKTATNTANNPAIDTANWALILYWDGAKIVFNNVYSKDETYTRTEIDDKDGLRALKTNVIEKDSAVAYTPTAQTHPANVKFVNDALLRDKGYYNDIGSANQVSLDYIVLSEARSISSFSIRCATAGVELYLPSHNALVANYGYAIGVILVINCHFLSAGNIDIAGQLIDVNGNNVDINLAKGDSVTLLNVHNPDVSGRRFQIVSFMNTML